MGRANSGSVGEQVALRAMGFHPARTLWETVEHPQNCPLQEAFIHLLLPSQLGSLLRQ